MVEALYQPFPMPGRRRGQVWRYAPQYRRPRHFHKEPELNLVVAGNGTFGTGNTVLEAAARELFCWPPGCDHELLEASADFDLYVIGLTPELSARALGVDTARLLAGPARLRLSPCAFSRLMALCVVPFAELESNVVEAHIAELWQAAHATRCAALEKAGVAERALASLIEQPELDRAQRARLVQAHPTDVSRHFHRHTGLTLTAYRTRLRLLRFIDVMDGGCSTLLAAAFEAGFGSYSQCHRAFQHILGCTPRLFFGGRLRREMFEALAPLAATAPVSSRSLHSSRA